VQDSRLDLYDRLAGDDLSFVSTPPPAAGSPVWALIDKKWYLTTVHRYGVSWTPRVVSTLSFTNVVTADTYDGINDTAWSVKLAPGSVTWKQGPTSAVAEGPLEMNVGGAVSGVFKDVTPWSVSGDDLVFTGADGSSLDYTDVEPPTAKPYSGAYVSLDNNPPGGAVARGQVLNLIRGQVTITDAKGAVAWSGLVTADFGGDSKLSPGAYTITALVQGGTCAPLPANIVARQVSEFDVVCTTTQPTVAQN
jgi:hypothetical protein